MPLSQTAARILSFLGAAIALAAFVYAAWKASADQEKLLSRLGRPSVEAALYVGGLLFSLGQAIGADTSLETILWALLALTFVAQLAILRRSR